MDLKLGFHICLTQISPIISSYRLLIQIIFIIHLQLGIFQCLCQIDQLSIHKRILVFIISRINY